MEGKRNLTLKFKINFPTDSLHTFPSNLTAATDKLFFPLSVQILLVKRRRVQRARVDCANSSSLRVCRLMFELIRQWGYRVAEGGHLEDSKIPRRNERFVPHPLQSSGNRVPEHVDMQSSSVFRDIPWPFSSHQLRPTTANRRSLQGLKHLRKTLVYPLTMTMIGHWIGQFSPLKSQILPLFKTFISTFLSIDLEWLQN